MTEPIPFATTRYRCPHCRKSWAHKATAISHMTRCFDDPARRTCKTCRHDEPDPYLGRACARDERRDASCVECGEHPEVCGHFRYKPATYLRVLCPSWEVKP